MFQLTLYRKDPSSPVTFGDSDRDTLLALLRSWLNDGGCQVDGLTLPVPDPEWPHEVVLFREDDDWYISWDAETERRFPSFPKARDAFVDACSWQVKETAGCEKCKVGCRIGFPACGVAR